MFNRKRGDTLVATIEATYGINLNARADMKLDNLLLARGFDSQTQLIEAYYGRLRIPARKRRVFLSFHVEDLPQVNGFRLMASNQSLLIDFHETSSRQPIASEQSKYIREAIQEKISRAAVVVCLIGNGTAWRDWVNWELETAIRYGKGLCGVRLKGGFGRAPAILEGIGAMVARWQMDEIVMAIECAAARRS
jgi:hypothetical protein